MAVSIGRGLYQYQDQEDYELKMIEHRQMMLREQAMQQQFGAPPYNDIKPTPDPKAQDKRLLLLKE